MGKLKEQKPAPTLNIQLQQPAVKEKLPLRIDAAHPERPKFGFAPAPFCVLTNAPRTLIAD